ncbi:hypothetical protein CAFE_16210 [Caprobacter fermentans]|uniref:Uncharacterized protein n=1 Tax=Caproicibacter fermentans TaxID=2576756 RepID=A0A6N8HZG6_9FIRM|nr:hypothetical protein [Caproicibacter fermentans]MVB10920.1 hypothetical protein [Caproicibacter fermentans]OCN01623.1 hypothetical protein A7X67_00560 [Clostridium sp. W14A]
MPKRNFFWYALYSVFAACTLVAASAGQWMKRETMGTGPLLYLTIAFLFLTLIFLLLFYKTDQELFFALIARKSGAFPASVPKWPHYLVLAAIVLFFVSCFLGLIPK